MYLRMGMDISLFGLAGECPYDGRRTCPVPGIQALKKLDLEERFNTIKDMSEEEKRDLLEQTLICAEKCQYDSR